MLKHSEIQILLKRQHLILLNLAHETVMRVQVLELKGDFPAVHEKLEYKNFTFEILALDERRISKVKVIVHDSQES